MYNVEGARFFLAVVLETFGDLAGLRICELGNQHIWEPARTVTGTAHLVARDWMIARGVARYASLDTNGLDGSIPCDLSKPLSDHSFDGAFDIVTNMGTSEHVIGTATNRAEMVANNVVCLANMLDLCRIGGVMVHQVPPVGTWPGHSPIHYRQGYPQALADSCGSRLSASYEDARYLTFAIMRERGTFVATPQLVECIDTTGGTGP